MALRGGRGLQRHHLWDDRREGSGVGQVPGGGLLGWKKMETDGRRGVTEREKTEVDLIFAEFSHKLGCF